MVAPDLGRYRIHLTLKLTDGEQTASRWFRIRNDHLIVSIGDSYASGEGVPDSPGLNTVWVEPEAHRSFRAGPALAAKDWENTIEGDLVSFLSFATSGAEFKEGLFEPQDDWQVVGQLKEVERTVGDRTIDALLISIGGNDIGFADVLKILALDPSRRVASIALNRVAKEIEKLEDNFDELEKQIRKLNPDHVFITEYPIAHFDRKDGTVRGGCGAFSLVNVDEANSVKQLGESLNEAVEAAADKHGWTFIDGVVEGFRGRGYCESDERYFVTLSESRRSQGNIKGTMHPNRKGHRVYADRITATLQREIDGQNERNDDRGPIVRDHREDAGNRDERDPSPIVRDHRTKAGDRNERDSGPIVRDHRSNRGDQTDTDRRENVRDHRNRHQR
jgi:lysophospholipase L1-like esterase